MSHDTDVFYSSFSWCDVLAWGGGWGQCWLDFLLIVWRGWTSTGQGKTEGDTFKPFVNFFLSLLQRNQKIQESMLNFSFKTIFYISHIFHSELFNLKPQVFSTNSNKISFFDGFWGQSNCRHWINPDAGCDGSEIRFLEILNIQQVFALPTTLICMPITFISSSPQADLKKIPKPSKPTSIHLNFQSLARMKVVSSLNLKKRAGL